LLIVGALIPTILLSRFFLWFLKSWSGGYRKLALAHFVSLLICTIPVGFSKEPGGNYIGRGLSLYMIPQAIWFLADAIRYKRRFDQADNLKSTLM
jgi:hypothetical protein